MYKLLLVSALALCFSSCKNEAKRPTSVITSDDGKIISGKDKFDGPGSQTGPKIKTYDLNTPFNPQVVESPQQLESWRNLATETIKLRKEKQPNVPAIIESGVFFYQFIVKGSEVSKVGALDNKWIDFGPDWTYTYGYNRKKEGGGTYHYNGDEAILIMMDNDPSKKPQEFSAKHAGTALVLIGTATFKDNNMQMKLEKIFGE